MMMKRTVIALTALIGAASCTELPPETYFNRGPEALLDASSELVNVTLAGEVSIDELADWVNQDQPSRAEVYCLESDPVCMRALEVLDQFAVPIEYIPAPDNNVMLIYERVIARDCENRFITNHVNPYNLNHTTFGCSYSANIVQMVSDKQQFVNPNLTDLQDGEKAVQIYKAYLTPPEPVQTDDEYEKVGEDK